MRLMTKTLNDYLREKRLDSGMSQLDVAQVLGYASPQFVSNWERGLVAPPLETIGVLVELYKIPVGEVIEKILDETRGYLESQLSAKARRGRASASSSMKPAAKTSTKPTSASRSANASRSVKPGARKKSARRDSAHA